jgi:nucleotide-binding universal stress UspA family protein
MNSAEAPQPAVVGIDGSDAAIEAARWAAKGAVHQDVPLRLVHVVPITDGPIASTAAYPAEEDYAESSLRAACLAEESTGLPVRWSRLCRFRLVDESAAAQQVRHR